MKWKQKPFIFRSNSIVKLCRGCSTYEKPKFSKLFPNFVRIPDHSNTSDKRIVSLSIFYGEQKGNIFFISALLKWNNHLNIVILKFNFLFDEAILDCECVYRILQHTVFRFVYHFVYKTIPKTNHMTGLAVVYARNHRDTHTW